MLYSCGMGPPKAWHRARLWGVFLALGLLLVGCSVWAGPQLWAWHHLRAARTELARFHAAQAQSHLAVCLRIWPHSPEVHRLAGRCARLQRRLDEARQELEECQRLEASSSPDSVLEWALLRATAGDLDSVEDFLKARMNSPTADSIRQALAEGYRRMYRIRDAMNLVNRWLEEQPDNVQALISRGEVQRQANSLARALPDYQQAVQLDPTRDDAREALALCFMDTGRYDEAATQLELLLAGRPEDPDLLSRLARCQGKLGRAKQARALLDTVLAAHPDNGLALRTRGELAQYAGDLADAEKWLRRAVDALPFDYQANWALLQVLEQEEKKDEAKKQITRVEELKRRLERIGEIGSHEMSSRPHDPALYCELGNLYLQLGQPEVGESWLLSALRQDPNYRPAHETLARYYEAKGDTATAQEHRQAAAGRK
jgi:predicted Zn-dependent protease